MNRKIYFAMLLFSLASLTANHAGLTKDSDVIWSLLAIATMSYMVANAMQSIVRDEGKLIVDEIEKVVKQGAEDHMDQLRKLRKEEEAKQAKQAEMERIMRWQ